MSRVTCHIFLLGQSGEGYRWRVCYQQSLPRLVLYFEGWHHLPTIWREGEAAGKPPTSSDSSVWNNSLCVLHNSSTGAFDLWWEGESYFWGHSFFLLPYGMTHLLFVLLCWFQNGFCFQDWTYFSGTHLYLTTTHPTLMINYFSIVKRLILIAQKCVLMYPISN